MISFTCNLKNDTNKLIYKTETDSQKYEQMSGESEGERGQFRSSGLTTHYHTANGWTIRTYL